MEWVDPTHMMILLVVLAVGAALWLHTASALARARRRRRDRRIFAVGFATGWVTARFLPRRRPQPKALRAVAAIRARSLAIAAPITRWARENA